MSKNRSRRVLTVVVALVASAVGCGVNDENGSGGGGDGTPTTSSSAKGCLDWSNWACDPPSPGYEFACGAACGGNNLILCNQQLNECRLAHGSTTYASCAAPKGSGCNICKAAAEGCLHDAILPGDSGGGGGSSGCTHPDDKALVTDPDKDVLEGAFWCGQESPASQTFACIKAMGLTSSCAKCYDDWQRCLGVHCFDACYIDGFLGDPACQECDAAKCAPSLATCTGLDSA